MHVLLHARVLQFTPNQTFALYPQLGETKPFTSPASKTWTSKVRELVLCGKCSIVQTKTKAALFIWGRFAMHATYYSFN